MRKAQEKPSGTQEDAGRLEKCAELSMVVIKRKQKIVKNATPGKSLAAYKNKKQTKRDYSACGNGQQA
jgi:hypothetical protein